MKKNSLVVICGPTSSGKTSLALSLCREFDGEIISADSRQVYRHMDVGTGKLPVMKSEIEIKKGNGMWEVGGTPIWLYDVVSPSQNFTVVDLMSSWGNRPWPGCRRTSNCVRSWKS